MRKAVIIHTGAKKELSKFSESVQEKFEGFFLLLIEEGRLYFPDAKKIESNLFEIRIKDMGEYRGIYAYLRKDSIVILHFFRKKTAKTPLISIKLARKRIKDYE